MSACVLLSRSLRSASSSAAAVRQLLLPSPRRPSPALLLPAPSRPLSSSPTLALSWDGIPSRSELEAAQRPAPDREGPKFAAGRKPLAAEQAEWQPRDLPAGMTTTSQWRLKKFEQQQQKLERKGDPRNARFERDGRPSRFARDDAPPPARGRYDVDRPRYDDERPRYRSSDDDRDDRPSYGRDERAPRRPSFADGDRSSSRQQDRPAYAPRDRFDRPRPTAADREAPQTPSYTDAPWYRTERPPYRDERPAYARDDQDDRPAYPRERESRPAYASERDARPSYSRERDDRPSYSRARDDRPSYSRDREERPSYERDARSSPARDDTGRPSHPPRARDKRPAYDARLPNYRPSHAHAARREEDRPRPSAAGVEVRTPFVRERPAHLDARPGRPSDVEARDDRPAPVGRFASVGKAGSAYVRVSAHGVPGVRTQWDQMTVEEKEAHLVAQERKAELRKVIKADKANKAERKAADPEQKTQLVQTQMKVVGLSPEDEAEEISRTLMLTKVAKHLSVKALAELIALRLPFLTRGTPWVVQIPGRQPARKVEASPAQEKTSDEASEDAPSASASEDAPAESTADAPAESTADAPAESIVDASASDDASAVPAAGEESESTSAPTETATPAPSDAPSEVVTSASSEAPAEVEDAEPASATSSEAASETPAAAPDPALESSASAPVETPSLESEPAPAAEPSSPTPAPSPPAEDVGLGESSSSSSSSAASDVAAVDSPPTSPEAEADAVASTGPARSVPGPSRMPYLAPTAMIYSFPTLADRKLASRETPIFQVFLPRQRQQDKGFGKHGPFARGRAAQAEAQRKETVVLPDLRTYNMGWAFVRFASVEAAQRAMEELTSLLKKKDSLAPRAPKHSFSAAISYSKWADFKSRSTASKVAADAAKGTVEPAASGWPSSSKPRASRSDDDDDGDLRDADDGRPIRLSKTKPWVPVERAWAKVYPPKPRADAGGDGRPRSFGGPRDSFNGGRKSFDAPAGRGGDAPRSQSRSSFGLRD